MENWETPSSTELDPAPRYKTFPTIFFRWVYDTIRCLDGSIHPWCDHSSRWSFVFSLIHVVDGYKRKRKIVIHPPGDPVHTSLSSDPFSRLTISDKVLARGESLTNLHNRKVTQDWSCNWVQWRQVTGRLCRQSVHCPDSHPPWTQSAWPAGSSKNVILQVGVKLPDRRSVSEWEKQTCSNLLAHAQKIEWLFVVEKRQEAPFPATLRSAENEPSLLISLQIGGPPTPKNGIKQ